MFLGANARPVVARGEGQGQKFSVVLVGTTGVLEQFPASVERFRSSSSMVFEIHRPDFIERGDRRTTDVRLGAAADDEPQGTHVERFVA